MNRNILFVFLLIIFTGTLAKGQGYYFAISYNSALPLGETKDYIDAYSWRGGNIEWRWFLQDQVSLGLFFGWNVFHEKQTGDFFGDDLAFSGTQLRTVNAFPILATGHYYFGNDLSFRPYIGLGLGTYRTEQRTQVGLISVDTRQWQFGMAPSVGATIPFGDAIMGNLEIRYNYAFSAGDAPTHSYLGINLGLAWSSY